MKINYKVFANYILFFTFFGVIFLIAYNTKGALIPYIVGTILAYIFYPVIVKIDTLLQKTNLKPKFSRPVSIVIFLILLIGLIFSFFWAVGDLLVSQLYDVGKELLEFFNALYTNSNFKLSIPREFDLQALISQFSNNPPTFLGGVFKNLLSGVGSAVSIVISIFTVPFFMFYLLVSPKTLKKGFIRLFPNSWGQDIKQTGVITAGILNKYIKAQLFLAFLIFIASFIGFTAIGLPNAFALAFIAGVLELVPIFGPILTWFVAFIVSISLGIPAMIATSVVCLAIQQLEGSILVPRIQSETINFPAWLVMLIVVVFGSLFGLPGMIVGLPLSAVFVSLVYYFHLRLTTNKQPTELTHIVQTSSIQFTRLKI